ncbi:hypothetical protein Taro_012899, partial [Colocasia esculenta]|nr:hypothetical protein [Colocasia esculenta]
MAAERTERGGEAGDHGSARQVRGFLDSMPVFAKELVAGGVAGGLAKTAVAPLERVKILFQTRRADFQNIGLLGSFRKIVQTEGILGFYRSFPLTYLPVGSGQTAPYLLICTLTLFNVFIPRGNGASIARIVPYAALHYMAYEQYRRLIILGFPDIGRGPVLDLVSGSIAGGTAVIFTYPLDLVRTKLAYQVVGSSHSTFKVMSHSEPVYQGILDCISKIYRSRGVKGLYRGVGPSLYGIFPYSGLKFYFYEEMKTHVPEKHKNGIVVNLACGSVAGLLGQTLTYPLDVVRRQMQEVVKKGGVNKNYLQVHAFSGSTNVIGRGTVESLVMIVQRQGWRQLFSGLSINYLKVVPSVAIGFTVYDAMKALLRVPSRDKRPSEHVTLSALGALQLVPDAWRSTVDLRVPSADSLVPTIGLSDVDRRVPTIRPSDVDRRVPEANCQAPSTECQTIDHLALAVGCRVLDSNRRPSGATVGPPTVGRQPPSVGRRVSAANRRVPAVDHRTLTVNHRAPVVDRRILTVDCRN